MKNMILGLLCCAIAVATVVCCLGIYSISSRRNEMENCVSQALAQNLQAYYVRWKRLIIEREVLVGWTAGEGQAGGAGNGAVPIVDTVTEVKMIPLRLQSDETVAAFVRQDIAAQLRSDSEIDIRIVACDMENGIISVRVAERFFLPNGVKKTLRLEKTIVVDEGPQETVAEVETVRYCLNL